MIRQKKATDTTTDPVLTKLLAQRKAPLSEEGLRLALTDLTLYLSGQVVFYATAFPKEEVKDQEVIQAENIHKTDLLISQEEEYYYPIFTDTAKLKAFKPELSSGEYIYACTKEDLLAFLQNNSKVAACVLNPNEDDLLIHRLLLQNMLAVYSQQIK